MHIIADTLRPAASTYPVPSSEAIPAEMLQLRDGLRVWVQRSVSPLDKTERIIGEDLLKIHVQLTGARLLKFEKHHEVELHDASTALLMHDMGVSKVERLVAAPMSQSITVQIDRSKVWQYLEEERTVVSAALRSFIVRKRTGPRFASAKPSTSEMSVAAAVINSRRTGPLQRLFAEAKAMELFCLILDRFQAEAPAREHRRLDGRVRRQLVGIRDLLCEQFVNPPTIHALARLSGLNRNKLCAGFLSLYGTSIYDFCRNLRLEKARGLLANTELSIGQIAYQSGFVSVSAFSASFSRQFGHSPSRTRQS